MALFYQIVSTRGESWISFNEEVNDQVGVLVSVLVSLSLEHLFRVLDQINVEFEVNGVLLS